MIEAQLRYLVSLLARMRRRGSAAAEVKPAREAAWNRVVQRKRAPTVWNAGGCRSWYLDRSGRNTTIWPGLVAAFQPRMRHAGLSDDTRRG